MKKTHTQEVMPDGTVKHTVSFFWTTPSSSGTDHGPLALESGEWLHCAKSATIDGAKGSRRE